MGERAIGTVTHYYSHLGVAAVALKSELKAGDTIHIKGRTTDFTQRVGSIQLEHHAIEAAHGGESIGVKVMDRTREHDLVYRVTGE